MKKHRRIEITAFRRRITKVSDSPDRDAQTDEEVCINDTDSSESIELETAEGQRILTDALRLLEAKLSSGDSCSE